MKIRQNRLKQNLIAGMKQYGIWHGIPDSYAAGICAGAGFDWICIDGEHAPFDFRAVLSSLQVIQSYDSQAIVRIPSTDPVLIKQYTDAGAQTILTPMIETADQAEVISKAMRYPLVGTRGVGTALARAAQWNRTVDYYTYANDQMCCMGQIESVIGVDNLNDILEIEGLDVVFIGPADLAATMGYLGQAGHPEVVKLVTDIIKRTVKAEKIAGFLTTSKDLIQTYTDAGAQLLGVSLDTILLAKATRNLALKYKPELASKDSNTTY